MTFANNEGNLNKEDIIKEGYPFNNSGKLATKRICIKSRILRRRIDKRSIISKSLEKDPFNYHTNKHNSEFEVSQAEKSKISKEREDFLNADEQVSRAMSQKKLFETKGFHKGSGMLSLKRQQSYGDKRKSIRSQARYQSKKHEQMNLNSPTQDLLRSSILFKDPDDVNNTNRLMRKISSIDSPEQIAIHSTRDQNYQDMSKNLYKPKRECTTRGSNINVDDEGKKSEGAVQSRRFPVISPSSKLPKVFLNKGIKNIKRIGRRNNQTVLKEMLQNPRQGNPFNNPPRSVRKSKFSKVNDDSETIQPLFPSQEKSSRNIEVSQFMIYGSKNNQFYSDSKPSEGLQIGTFIKSSAKIRKTHKNMNKSTEEYKTSQDYTTLDSSKYYSNQVYDKSQGKSSNRKNITFSNGSFKPDPELCGNIKIEESIGRDGLGKAKKSKLDTLGCTFGKINFNKRNLKKRVLSHSKNTGVMHKRLQNASVESRINKDLFESIQEYQNNLQDSKDLKNSNIVDKMNYSLKVNFVAGSDCSSEERPPTGKWGN
ncbi:unnamed protein product [Moneuplotes crassus]|uniref:Uncharacterized protein n=1 Tax=Euplotes crassus TaxID=5936 RepID=A0AAD1Y8M7_EUPCR|nr:unnamed protein product [Moneuplotes crassus]